MTDNQKEITYDQANQNGFPPPLLIGSKSYREAGIFMNSVQIWASVDKSVVQNFFFLYKKLGKGTRQSALQFFANIC